MDIERFFFYSQVHRNGLPYVSVAKGLAEMWTVLYPY
jgi:hypothetical protein